MLSIQFNLYISTPDILASYIQLALPSHVVDSEGEGVTTGSPLYREIEPGAKMSYWCVGQSITIDLDFEEFWVSDGLIGKDQG